ncbi:MAG: hypothetical protein MUF54_03665 [Polyangiaceae bacterium]|jgi:hypothetical protein|nr:hypothetical protein [Polyangiaceae bacterium]
MTTDLGKQPLIEQFESLALKDFQQELACTFVDESYAYEFILPNTSNKLVLAQTSPISLTPWGARATDRSSPCSASGGGHAARFNPAAVV